MQTYSTGTKESSGRTAGGGFTDGTRSVRLTRRHCDDLVSLTSDHEEADTRLLLYAIHAAYDHKRLVIP
jgi:hypothetical protein